MILTSSELEILKANSLSVANAQNLARQIESDITVGGIFPNANSGDYSNPDIEKFKSKWCSWWIVAKILLNIAKVFTGPIADKAIDKLIELGDRVCQG
jgi:hypothetical protein